MLEGLGVRDQRRREVPARRAQAPAADDQDPRAERSPPRIDPGHRQIQGLGPEPEQGAAPRELTQGCGQTRALIPGQDPLRAQG